MCPPKAAMVGGGNAYLPSQTRTEIFHHSLERTGNRLAFKRPRAGGEVWFLVNKTWWKEFEAQSFSCESVPFLDNANLLESDGITLRRSLMQGLQFEAIPAKEYRLLQNWFPAQFPGEGISRTTTRDGKLELYLMECTIQWSNADDKDAEEETWKTAFSKDTTLGELCQRIAEHFLGQGAGEDLIQIKLFKTGSDYVPLDKQALQEETLERLGFSQQNNRLLATSTTATVNTAMRANKQSKRCLASPQLSPPISEARNAIVATVGLRNIGNSCYLNASLQCLLHTAPLRALLLASKSFEARIDMANVLGRRGEGVRALHALFRDLWSHRAQPCSPVEFKRALDTWSTLFHGTLQHDAHELLQFLLDLLHEDTRRASICNEVFGGSLDRTMTCPVCHTSAKVTTEAFHMLSLPLSEPEQILLVGRKRAKYVPVHSKLQQQQQDELERRFRTKIILHQGVAFKVNAAEEEETSGYRRIFGKHEFAGKEMGIPFTLLVPALAGGEELKQRLREAFQAADAFEITMTGADQVVLVWKELQHACLFVQAGRAEPRFHLSKLLQSFCEEEKMQGDNLWHCPTCKEKRAAALTRYSFASLPRVLILHLKRFSNALSKITTAVRYPFKLQVNMVTYTLYAVLRHHGTSAHSGHYDAQILHDVTGEWYTFNDAQVTPMQFTLRGNTALPRAPNASDPSAYIFFYKQDSLSLTRRESE